MNDQPGTELTTESGDFIAMLERVATNPAVDVSKMSAILDIKERVLNKQAEALFNHAMNAVQAEIGRVATDASNPQTKSRYASYEALDGALRPIYTKHGFSLSFDRADAPKDDWVRVLCYVSHSGGFTKTYKIDIPADGKGAKGGDVMTKTHAVGAADAYGRRYLLRGIFNIATGEGDTDGNAPEETVTAEQVANIQAVIDEIWPTPEERVAGRGRFLKYIKCKTLEDIKASSYDGVIRDLQAKLKSGTK